jgi:hypothetical protein
MDFLEEEGHDFKKNRSPFFQRELEQAYRLPVG